MLTLPNAALNSPCCLEIGQQGSNAKQQALRNLMLLQSICALTNVERTSNTNSRLSFPPTQVSYVLFKSKARKFRKKRQWLYIFFPNRQVVHTPVLDC